MELSRTNANQNIISTDKPFIQANTESVELHELTEKHIIPVFIKDNEPLISHSDFIKAAQESLSKYYPGDIVLPPSIRVSHPVKGRIPDAKIKPAADLLEHEKTLYYERMAFILEIPSYQQTIGGNTLSLTIGGIKAFNLDNLYSKKGSDEHFKIFIGFKNTVCTNLCVWTDGLKTDLRVQNVAQLKASIDSLIENYNANYHLNAMRKFSELSLTESQFAHVIGKCRMYNSLPYIYKKEIPELLLGDNQVSAAVKEYYNDNDFSREMDGTISLWKMYNLFTGVNKSSYIDTFFERSANAFKLIENIKWGLEGQDHCWYLR